jgi:hypothetical protein
MTSPGANQVTVTPGTFHNVRGAASMINEYVPAQQAAAAAVTRAMALPGLFDGKGGAITRRNTAQVPQAVTASGDVADELRAIFISAENALAEFVGADRVGGRLILASCGMRDDPHRKNALLYPDDREFEARSRDAEQRAAQLRLLQEQLRRKDLDA